MGEKYDKRLRLIISNLKKHYGGHKVQLKYKNPFELLIAVILSAQCTDKRVNEVTKELFKKYGTPRSLAMAGAEDVMRIIRPVGFYRNKAKNIIKAARAIVEEFDGKVPCKMDDLLRLSGVARKTANIVLWHVCGKSEGIAVDTHVKRISNRLGIVNSTNPVVIEKELMEILPKKYWGFYNGWLVDHGRNICMARHPDCENCFLKTLCPQARSRRACVAICLKPDK